MKKGRILKIRPFNMANFSGGSGYLPVYYFLELFAMVPYYFLMVGLVAIKNKDGQTSYDKGKLVKSLIRVVLPVMLVLAILWTAYMIYIGVGYNSIKYSLPLSLLVGLMPFIVIICSLGLVIGTSRYGYRTNFSRGVLYVIAGVAISFPLYVVFEILASKW